MTEAYTVAELRLAMDTATQIQEHTNTYWIAQLGEPGPLGGFQVDAIDQRRDGFQLFVSTLYGGRSLVGTGSEIRRASAAYVDSRKRGKAAA